MQDSTGAWLVAIGGQRLVTASHTEAVSHGMTAQLLAESWAERLRALVRVPPLQVSTTRLVVPVGEVRTITVSGGADPYAISVHDSDPSVTTSSMITSDRQIKIVGNAPGSSSVMVDSDPNASTTIRIDVRVMKYAATVDTTQSTGLTGNPANQNVVEQALWSAVAHGVRPDQAAAVSTYVPDKSFDSLPANTVRTIPVVIKAAGNSLIAVSDKLDVVLNNDSVPVQQAVSLLYSNNPEQIRQTEELFGASLQPFNSERLVYHHQNSTSRSLELHIDLINAGSRTVRIQLIPGAALVGSDPVQVGRRAGVSFLTNLRTDSGMIESIGPETTLPILVQRVVGGTTASGIIQLQQLDGPRDSAFIHIYCTEGDGDDEAIPALIHNLFDFQPMGTYAAQQGGRFSPQFLSNLTSNSFIFDNPYRDLFGKYEIGKKWLYLRLGGGDGLVSEDKKQTLYGNYGVSYTAHVELSNPTSDAKDVVIAFAAEAGDAAGVFVINNGPLIELDPTLNPDERIVTKIHLAPGESQSVRVDTMPLSGSAYPASIVVHAL